MEVLHERVAGLDVHQATIVACVRIMAGTKAMRECRSFATTTAGLLDLLAWLAEQRCSHVAMEATGVYWKPVWNILSDGDFDLLVANAAHIKNVPGRKTDMNGTGREMAQSRDVANTPSLLQSDEERSSRRHGHTTVLDPFQTSPSSEVAHLYSPSRLSWAVAGSIG
jgi:hypothetical protein